MNITNTTSSVAVFIRGLIHDKLKIDGRDPFTYEGDNVFTISEDFVSSSTISVFKNGTLLSESAYTYDSDNNTITIPSLTLEDTILIKYSFYEKYSDAEIKGFLESSLVYFSQYQYSKIFEINADDKIVAINNYDPTTNELYFISIIASILIDPQNIRISIPDLNISAKRDKSDIEQIKEAFRNFKNFVGTIDFEDKN